MHLQPKLAANTMHQLHSVIREAEDSRSDGEHSLHAEGFCDLLHSGELAHALIHDSDAEGVVLGRLKIVRQQHLNLL
eukprot:CAMPEP_0114227756 /NCGR_PEP_ID=MMETSP0058-20121206/1963_1 /TAXON_ID=36894 /ORGANISM="Pyramimonas parkeae, CCMP726" /LENGTH=76 /DNA_ID=CAMNT_0001338625 /DNA_START=643 /DNA_END=873 /DNA_ORIENTATION=+